MRVGVAVGTGVDVAVGTGVDVVVGVNVAVGVEEGQVAWRPPVTAKVGVAVGVRVGVGVGVGVDVKLVTAPMERVVALWFGDSTPRITSEAMMEHTPRNVIQKYKRLWSNHIFGLGIKMATTGTSRYRNPTIAPARAPARALIPTAAMIHTTISPQRRINGRINALPTGVGEGSAWFPPNDVSVSLLTGSESTGVGEKKVTPSMEDSRSKLLTGSESTGVGEGSAWLPPNDVSVSLLTGSESTGVGESASELTGVGGSTAWLPPNGLPHCWQKLTPSATWVPQ